MVFPCTSLIDNNVAYIFMSFFVICVFYILFTHFLIWLFLSYLNIESFWYILSISLLLDMWFANILSNLKNLFHRSKFLIFMRSNLQTFSIIHVLGINVRILNLVLGLKDFSPLFFPKNVIVLHFTYVFNLFWVDFCIRCEL